MSDRIVHTSITISAWMLDKIKAHGPTVSAFIRQAVQRELDRLDGKPVTTAEFEAAIRTLTRMARGQDGS